MRASSRSFDAIRFGSRIAGAPATAHRAGIVHRDLKPAIGMVTETGWRDNRVVPFPPGTLVGRERWVAIRLRTHW